MSPVFYQPPALLDGRLFVAIVYVELFAPELRRTPPFPADVRYASTGAEQQSLILSRPHPEKPASLGPTSVAATSPSQDNYPASRFRSERPRWTMAIAQRSRSIRREPDSAPHSATPPTNGADPADRNRNVLATRVRWSRESRSSRRRSGHEYTSGLSPATQVSAAQPPDEHGWTSSSSRSPSRSGVLRLYITIPDRSLAPHRKTGGIASHCHVA